MDVDLVKRFVGLRQRKASLQSELKDVNDELDGIGADLVEQFLQDGIQNINMDGQTVYIRRRVWARIDKANDPSFIYDTLKNHDMDHMMTVNSNSLAAYIREQEELYELLNIDDLHNKLPADLDKLVQFGEVYSLTSRKS
jgi:hypothetical protein